MQSFYQNRAHRIELSKVGKWLRKNCKDYKAISIVLKGILLTATSLGPVSEPAMPLAMAM